MNGNAHSASNLSNPPLTFSTLWQRLMRQKMLLSLVSLTGLLLAGLLTQMTTPAYHAVTPLQIKPQNAQAVNNFVSTSTLNTPEKDLRSTPHNKTFAQPEREERLTGLNKSLLSTEKQVNASGVTTTAVAADPGSGESIVLDKTVPPETAFWLDKWLNLLLGGLIGLLLGIILALWREPQQKPIESGRLLQAFSGLPVLGNIPEVAKKERQTLPLAVVCQAGSPVAEAYRIAAANLKFINPQGIPPSLLVTSLNPGEGKSTSSVNLALGLAQIGHKVLLIDADLRRPTLHEKTGLNNHVGLTEYLRGDIELSRTTQRLQGVNNAFVITAGMLNLDPVEALSSAALKKLMTMTTQYFDITLIDAPPLTGFADSLLLADLTEATLLISSESHQLDRDSLGDMVGQIQRVKHNVLGWLIVKARHNVVTEDYYARYGETRRANIDARLITPLDLRKKGLNLTKGG